MSDPDHTLDLVPSPSRGGGRKKSAARQNSNRRRRSAGAAGLIDESGGERIDELASPARCREAPRVETRLQSSPAGDSRGQREACTAERARLPEASPPVGFRTTKRRRRGCHTTFAPVATAPLSVGGARRVSSSSAPASLVASPVPPSERPVGILPGRRGRGQIELLIAGMAVSMAVFAPVIAPAVVAAFMFTRRDAQGRRGQLAVGTRTRRECARTVEPGAGAPAES